MAGALAISWYSYCFTKSAVGASSLPPARALFCTLTVTNPTVTMTVTAEVNWRGLVARIVSARKFVKYLQFSLVSISRVLLNKLPT